MRKINALFFYTLLLIFSCKEKWEELQLPFYNTPNFTPAWLTPSDTNYHSVHTIAAFSLTDQNGRTITNREIDGKIYVANFFFTTCGSICPRMTVHLKKVQEAFVNATDVRILSHSVLPEVDSIPRLKKYEQQMGIDGRQWLLLTGDKNGIYSLARKSYFADEEIGYNKESNEFLHTENCILIDKKGRIRGVYNGTLELEINKLIEHIKLLQKEN